MKKRYIDTGRGLALLALGPSGKLKSMLGKTACMRVADRIIIMVIGGSYVQTSAINFSLLRPSAPSMSLIALLALDSNATHPLHSSRCTHGFSTGPSSDFPPNSMGSAVVSMRRTVRRGGLQYLTMHLCKHSVRAQLTQYPPRLILLI